MSTRLSSTLTVLSIAASGGALVGAAPGLAANLGNGPTSPPTTPSRSVLPGKKPLITVRFRKGKLIGITGTAVPLSARKKPRRTGSGASARCSVNFTNTKTRQGNKSSVRWFGGIGCSQSMLLFGQAYLQESATKVDATGAHYQGTMKSAVSGRNQTVVNAPNPSLYIRHLTNVYFPKGVSSGQISVYPAAGQRLNAASKCVTARTPGYGPGVHCELYTNRF